jgi:GT2 family glycosyltransferase
MVMASGGSVRDVLHLGDGAISWARFDSDWYLVTYPAITKALASHDPADVMQFYLDRGQQLEHSPNMYFDEVWHRRRYARVTEDLNNGTVTSAFDAYCRHGFHGRSPHWLFDELLYRTRYPDITEDYLAANGLVNGYDHYLRHGQFSSRSGHFLFDPPTYAAELSSDERIRSAKRGYFTHYLSSLREKASERRTSILFDPSWHSAAMKQANVSLDQGGWLCAVHHYLTNPGPTAFDPIPEFSERYYLARYRNIANDVASGKYRNGYEHFLAEGRAKLLAPHRSIDLAYYASAQAVTRDLQSGRAYDAFEHFLRYGRILGLPATPSEEQSINEESAQLLFRRKANNLLPLVGHQRLDFTHGGQPDLSVVLVLHNQFPLTMLALGSLRSNYPGPVELILVDAGSTDETRAIEGYVAGATLLRFEDNLGFLRGCNAGLQSASANFILIMNNDVELASGAVSAALRRLKSHQQIGAVGGKIVRCHGLLQEAGCTIWSDGSASGYLRDFSPLAPEANFVRPVDYCSGAFLMLRGEVLRSLEGFDDSFAPAYYEDADLCIRLAQAGYHVVYDPSIVVFHHEYGSAAGSDAVVHQIALNRAIFVQKHAAYLEGQPIKDLRNQSRSRFAKAEASQRILFIDDTVPLRTLGSGFVRSNDIIHVMASLGYRLTVFPLKANRQDVAAVYRDMPENVEVMYDRDITDLPDFLAERDGYFDVLWIARTHNLDRIRHMLDPLLSAPAPPPIVLDTEAIASLRDGTRQVLTGEPPAGIQVAVANELSHAGICRTIVAVSDEEAAVMQGIGLQNVAVIGHMRVLTPTPRAFAERHGMLFVGAIHQQSSPNLDSLEWFVDAVLPIIERSLGWQTRLTVVGYVAPGISLAAFARHPRITLAGTQFDLTRVYDRHRVFIAPTRFAAGLPYKVYEAASFGLPVVATELLRRQMAWQNGRDLLCADSDDPQQMAAQILALYQDEPLWQRIRTNALDRLGRENSRERYAESIQQLLPPLRTQQCPREA